MKEIFDQFSFDTSKGVTKRYSTSFYAGVRSLGKDIQQDIHNIYGFVRFADEIVDSFHGYDKTRLLEQFKSDTWEAIKTGVSLNPILNSFQYTINKYQVEHVLVEHFLNSMEMDLDKTSYDREGYERYILGSAEVVGLMCLRVFVNGNESVYQQLRPYAMKLGSAFQKINFLRDLSADFNGLGRVYFPDLDTTQMTPEDKASIESEIEQEFDEALIGIKQLPESSRFGVYLSYLYYRKLLEKIKRKSMQDLLEQRIRVSDNMKVLILARAYFNNKLGRL